MAHKSKKKHLKHVHQHEPATPPAKTRAGSKAETEVERIANTRSRVVEDGGRAGKATARRTPGTRGGTSAPRKKRGIVRSIARAATKKLAAKPRKVIKRATSRVKAFLGGVESPARR
jgi:hypothetical protein